ncbi:amidase [Yaniella halotolerans]|uniref:amidase n=1 Tax=Yaniella halotolerans TaxID=225453 RepID=UPI0003B38410|nr:amidase [Yaniella halotolerans]
MDKPLEKFELLEANIYGVLEALQRGDITSTWLTQQYLDRIEAYDRGEEGLKSVPVLNPRAMEEAEESDRRIRAGCPRALEGVPFTVKDSFVVKGLTASAGSPAFAELMGHWDAFVVECLRDAGAVLLGKTNMPPMAAGGMQRGVHDRPKSPYNSEYLPAAFGSGSSSGSAVSVAANLAVFSMAAETLCSGRSPASNNALCAYTPSWGVISIRGNWPLFPTRDVVVPYTRSMPDMLRLLDVIAQEDPETRGDFWRSQNIVSLPKLKEPRLDSYLQLRDGRALEGKRLAVPRIYLNQDKNYPLELRPSVNDLWQAARERLESLGAEVVETDFPLMEQYENGRPGRRFVDGLGDLPYGWTNLEFREFMASAWDDFLKVNGDPEYPNLGVVDSEQVFPTPAGALPNRYEYSSKKGSPYVEAVELVKAGLQKPHLHHDFSKGLRATVQLREELLDSWLIENEFDAVVFPANSDVGASNADVDPAAADHAWSNGVAFSNGNYAIRHLGIPTVTVPMGNMEDIDMPVGLTFCGGTSADLELLSFASAFEDAGPQLRQAPKMG